MRLLICLGIAAIAAGCAASVETANSRTVVVKANKLQAADAQGLADAECGKHQRIAQLKTLPGIGNPRYVFDCVQ